MFNNSKKAMLADFSFGMILKFSFTSVIIISMWVIIGQGMHIKELNRGLDANTISPLVLYNSELMVVDEVTGKLYPGWVDVDKMKSSKVSEKLEANMKTYDNIDYISMRINLYNYENTNKNKTVAVYMHKDRFEDHLVQIKSNFDVGSGGYKRYEKLYSVVYGDSRVPGFLKVELIMPN